MNDSNAGCLISGFLYFFTIAIAIGSGFLAWDWIEPDSFWGTVGFLIAWGILSKIGHTVTTLIIAGIINIFGDN